MRQKKPRRFVEFFFLVIVVGMVLFGYGYKTYDDAAKSMKTLSEVQAPIESRTQEVLKMAPMLHESFSGYSSDQNPGDRRAAHERLQSVIEDLAEIQLQLARELDKSLATEDKHTHERAVRMLRTVGEAQESAAEIYRRLLALEMQVGASGAGKSSGNIQIKNQVETLDTHMKEVRDAYARSVNKEMDRLRKFHSRGIKMMLFGGPLALFGIAMLAYRVGFVRAQARKAEAEKKSGEGAKNSGDKAPRPAPRTRPVPPRPRKSRPKPPNARPRPSSPNSRPRRKDTE